ncbi:MAG: hypothetical protein KTR31_02610 [Myxococcales bacterium]|nr:hypothetical protein [Myxococcales bacterium]
MNDARVLRVRGRVAMIAASSDQRHGDLVRFSSGGRGWVVALRQHETDVVWLDDRPSSGGWARSMGALTVGVPRTPRGVFDVFGDADGAPVPLFAGRRPWTWPYGSRRLDLGPLVYDLRLRFATGQALLLTHRHPRVLRDMMRDQVLRGRLVVYVGSGSAAWVEDGVVVVGKTAAQAALAPLGALAIGHALALRGRDVVLVVDRPQAWRDRAAAIPGLPPWPVLWEGLTGAVWSGTGGSLSLWLVTDRPVRGVPPGVDAVLDLRQPLTGDPRATGVLVRPVFKVRPMRDLGRWVWSTALGEAEGTRIRRLLRYRGPLLPEVALATFVGLAQAGLDHDAWEAFAALVLADVGLCKGIVEGGSLDEGGRRRLLEHARII